MGDRYMVVAQKLGSYDTETEHWIPLRAGTILERVTGPIQTGNGTVFLPNAHALERYYMFVISGKSQVVFLRKRGFNWRWLEKLEEGEDAEID